MNALEIAALNKRGLAGGGLELVRGTKVKSVDDKRNSGTKQNKVPGEGLELVRGTKVKSVDDKKTPAQNKTKSLEKAWN